MALQRFRRTEIARGIARTHPIAVAGFFFLLIVLQMAAPASLGPFASPARPSIDSCMACTASSDLEGCHELAMKLASKHDHARAIVIEERIHRLQPDNPEVAAVLARMHHVGRKDTVRAIALYHAALGASSGYAPALFGLGAIMEEKGELAIAERYYSRGAREHPDMVAFKVRLAEILVGVGRDAEAQPVLDEIIARWPGSEEAHHARRLMARTALARP